VEELVSGFFHVKEALEHNAALSHSSHVQNGNFFDIITQITACYELGIYVG
jgi:hypothetical protein